MRRIFSSFLVLALSLALGSGVAVAKSMNANAMAPGQGAMTTCPVGSKWINGYKTKSGKMIKGYCRKSPSKKGKM
ncbi:MAG TPA: hypothetical protein VGN14_10230 [Candidatus Elarobacter sp.]|jgi:hypothetical protein